MFLLDTNVLFAALYNISDHHPTVTRWLTSTERYASCGWTQISTFRLLLMPNTMHGRPLKPAAAHNVLAEFTGTSKHTFVMCLPLSRTIVGQTRGHNASVDDYLVQIASDAGCKLATLDRALATRWPERTFLIN